MKTGEVIRMYRKNRNLTQEEMASRLGVTASAVNKWENNVSLPDITLLAPIARLLETTPDTLLCFREELSQEEVNAFVQEGLIYEDADYHNAVFVGRDQNGAPVHAHKRGTGKRSVSIRAVTGLWYSLPQFWTAGGY